LAAYATNSLLDFLLRGIARAVELSLLRLADILKTSKKKLVSYSIVSELKCFTYLVEIRNKESLFPYVWLNKNKICLFVDRFMHSEEILLKFELKLYYWLNINIVEKIYDWVIRKNKIKLVQLSFWAKLLSVQKIFV